MKITIGKPDEIRLESLDAGMPPKRILALRKNKDKKKASCVRIAIDPEGCWRRVGFDHNSNVSFTGTDSINFKIAINQAMNAGYEVHVFDNAKDYARAILNFYEELDYEEEP